MKPGPSPLPANVHMLNGNPSKKAESDLQGVIAPEVKLCDPPEILSERAMTEWHRIGRELEILGLVSALDVAALAAYCQAWADWCWAREMIELYQCEHGGEAGFVMGTATGYKQISVYVQLAGAAEKRMREWAAEFGLTPAARARVTGGAKQGSLFPADDDPMAAFLRAGANVK